MAEAAVARETLFALRETIARLEGRPIPALAAVAHEVRAAEPQAGPADAVQPLAIGVVGLDEAMQGGVPLDALTEIRSLALRIVARSDSWSRSPRTRVRASFASVSSSRSRIRSSLPGKA